MKKLLVFALTLALLAGGGSAWAAIVEFGDGTFVEAYNGTQVYTGTVSPSTGSPYPHWYDRIGVESIYETTGATLDTVNKTLTIHTNFTSAALIDRTAVAADLFLDLGNNGIFEYAIALGTSSPDGTTSNGRQGKVYAVGDSATYLTSIQLVSGKTDLIYGGQRDYGSAKDVPVWATSSTPVSGETATVTWDVGTLFQGYTTNCDVVINLSGLPDFDPSNFGFLWGTGTCANDTTEGGQGFPPLPLPPSALLLGSGLLGLVGLGWRRRQTNV